MLLNILGTTISGNLLTGKGSIKVAENFDTTPSFN